MDELIADVQSFSQQSVLWMCALIVTGVQLWDKIDSQPDAYARFLSLFFDSDTRLRLVAGYWSSPRRILFHRRQILLISKLAILHCTGEGLDARQDARLFGPILLKASDQFHYGLLPTTVQRPAERDDYAKIIAEMVAVAETGLDTVAHLIIRDHLMLTRFANELRDDPDFVDVAGEHQDATGFTLGEFEAMIFAVHARFSHDLVQKLYTEPGALPLKESNFEDTAIPYSKVRRFLDSVSGSTSEIATDLRQRDEGPNDFTVFRKSPLIQQFYNMHLTSAGFGLLMMDNLFFLEKIQTGPYWRANARHGLKLHKFWGTVFERYVNELLEQACDGTDSTVLSDPRLPNDRAKQLCDGVLVSGDSMVLLEYKSSMFRADDLPPISQPLITGVSRVWFGLEFTSRP